MHNQWMGKTVLVTGAAQGIGRATAELFHARGATVVIVDIHTEATATTHEKIAQCCYRSLHGPAGDNSLFAEPTVAGASPARGRVHSILTDVASPESVTMCIDETVQLTNRLDVIVNNAGISSGAPIRDLSYEARRMVLAVNVDSVYLFAHAAANIPVRDEGGAIVDIASTRALMSEPDSEAYAASRISKLLRLSPADKPIVNRLGAPSEVNLPRRKI